ncbi:MAG: DUF1698 domain-containing protein [Acidobacteria bacterium]|nr:DUF1698 domain-containing protein [Acidobacteriota bacterium]
MVTSDLQEQVLRIRWWHRIDLGNGIVTPGVDNSPKRLKRIRMPENLSGMTVLDIGAWDGFFSFEAERRGASRVLAIDSNDPGWGSKEGFELARRTLHSQVEYRECDVLDISPDKIGVFDLVLFLGVLYHMRHPLLSLERVFSVTQNLLILETEVDNVWSRRPVMTFYPGSELADEPSNWWGPNPSAVQAMLKDVGFRQVELMDKGSLGYRIGRAIKHKIKYRTPVFQMAQHNRVVFHAWR